MYRNWAPLLIHVLSGLHCLVTLGGLLVYFATSGLQHVNSICTAHVAPACLAGLGCFSQRVGKGDGLMIIVLFLSHPGMNLFFQFWH